MRVLQVLMRLGKKAYEYSPVKFTNAQKMYTVNQYPVPFVEQAQKEFGIDFSSSLAYQELAYSTSVQFGVRGAIRLCTNAKINSSMTEEEVIKAIYEEKRNSIGKYEFEDCSVAVQEGLHKRFIEEEKDILAILNSDNNKSVPFDEFLSTLNPSYLVMVDSNDYYEDVISLDSEDMIEVLGEDTDKIVDADLNGAISNEKIEEPQKNIIANIIEELTPIKKDDVNSDKKVNQNEDNKKEDTKIENKDNKNISNKDNLEDVNENIEYVSSIDTTNGDKEDKGIFNGLLDFIIPNKNDELIIDSDFNGAFEGYDFGKHNDAKEDKVESKDIENYISEEILSVAKSYLNQGTVYKMGGKNKVTLDCSGYVSLVFQDMGLEIDELMTGASKFRSDSKEINREDLRIGDLVFWHDLTGKRHSKVYHIGIYIGDNTVIDCSSDYNGVGTRELSSLQDNNKTYYTFGRYEQLEQKANETLQNQNLQNIDYENSDNLEISTTEDDVVDFDKLKELEKSLENNMFKKLFSKLSLIANGEYDDTNIFIKDRA